MRATHAKPVVDGVILETKVDPDTKEVSYLVQWTDAGNDVQEKWFTDAELYPDSQV